MWDLRDMWTLSTSLHLGANKARSKFMYVFIYKSATDAVIIFHHSVEW
jgi:hypothetical protein